MSNKILAHGELLVRFSQPKTIKWQLLLYRFHSKVQVASYFRERNFKSALLITELVDFKYVFKNIKTQRPKLQAKDYSKLA